VLKKWYATNGAKNFFTRVITAFVLGLGFWFSFIYLPSIVFTCILLAILAAIILFEWCNFFDISTPLFWVTLPFYPVLPFALLIAMNHNPEYRDLLLFLFILVSSHDTGSYIVGKACGKNPIAPRISPGKTWEGFAGGFLFACTGLSLVLWERGIYKPWWFIAGFTFIVCVLALLGDLFESYLKRRVRIKDSGDLLPGHGGFLDRFDGILFAVFFFYLLRNSLILIFR
jgi:phosphatidate cytidylyltransferase